MGKHREVSKHNGPRPCRDVITKDIRMLILSYLSLNTTSLKDFRRIWTDLDFSLMHYSCTDSDNRKLFMKTLYEITLNFIHVSNSPQYHSAIIYTLHFLYSTQPSKHVYTIPVDEEIWTDIKRIRDELMELDESDRLEPLYTLYKLVKTGAFYITKT